MGGYDTGYFYTYNMTDSNPLKAILIPGIEDEEVSSYCYL